MRSRQGDSSGSLDSTPFEATQVLALSPGCLLDATQGFRQAYQLAGPQVLEPIMKVEVTIPSEYQGGGTQRGPQPGGRVSTLMALPIMGGEHRGLQPGESPPLDGASLPMCCPSATARVCTCPPPPPSSLSLWMQHAPARIWWKRTTRLVPAPCRASPPIPWWPLSIYCPSPDLDPLPLLSPDPAPPPSPPPLPRHNHG